MDNSKEAKFLERMTRAFLSLDAEKHVNTKEFNEAVEAILPVFDHLGEMTPFSISCIALWTVLCFLGQSIFYTL